MIINKRVKLKRKIEYTLYCILILALIIGIIMEIKQIEKGVEIIVSSLCLAIINLCYHYIVIDNFMDIRFDDKYFYVTNAKGKLIKWEKDDIISIKISLKTARFHNKYGFLINIIINQTTYNNEEFTMKVFNVENFPKAIFIQ